MRLKHVKLSGFKSFVDSTTISVPARLVGVVGPNGCGKSNVIDAVRWVMGESSAKNLRGDNMADVIFNGSTARKPIGRAAVELVFDNSEGKAPGPYATYAEIAVRRELSRDGESQYFINRTRCRRRDITDIFLGTGLGPRSYSIIEQGMVGRIVEAKPEDLRVLVEEAAGISKYKERRRETETRIRHTRENLARVEDIRSELESQLRKLKRQSAAAARYKELKSEERELRAQLLSLRWHAHDEEVMRADAEVARLQKEIDARVAEQRAAENRLEQVRKQQAEANEHLNEIQAAYYGVGAQISGVEQNIEHLRQSREQRRSELEHLIDSEGEAMKHLADDRQRADALTSRLGECAPRCAQLEADLAQAREQLQAADQAFHAWQGLWDTFAREEARPAQEREVQRARIEEYGAQIERMTDREGRVVQALAEIESRFDSTEMERLRSDVAARDASRSELEQRIEEIEGDIQRERQRIGQLTDELHALRERHQTDAGRLESLRELQAAAMGAYDDELVAWLGQTGLDRAPRLAAELSVESGWEGAVDRVLGNRVGAVTVEDLAVSVDVTSARVDSELFLVERTVLETAEALGEWPRLADKVRCESVDLTDWLGGIYVADDLAQALSRRHRLSPRESVVTRDGTWVGRNWMALGDGQGGKAGIVAREKEIQRLSAEVNASAGRLAELKTRVDGSQQRLADLEREIAEKRRELNALLQQRAELMSQLGRIEAQFGELQTRREQLRHDLSELREQMAQARQTAAFAQSRLVDAEQETERFGQRRGQLLEERDRLRTALDAANQRMNELRDAYHREEFEHQRYRTELESVRESIARLERQQQGMETRKRELERFLEDEDRPEEEFKQQLEALLAERVDVEDRLNRSRQRAGELEDALRSHDQDRVVKERHAQRLREELDQVRLTRQEIAVRRETLTEQIRETGHEPMTVLAAMPQEADAVTWQQRLDDVINRIERIGPVNLVAIEEYDEQSERKVYLDKQHADLTEALATLESVIQKIDRETRARFKETFEVLNQRFQEFFPRLFGGGSAYLELTGTDLLDSGVAVMARPPGKRNSTIHLLSGGEKAMTAVSLLFAFFDLNPAPFCMLDEVDAPLDDANVERYCDILKTLSERTQLIFITHNKITMEAANILIGVTMAEPGVSRLVAVDVEEALQMAAQ